MLQKFTIGRKLLLITAVFSTVLAGMTTFMLLDMRSGMIEDRRAKLRALVEAAVNTVNRYGDLAAAGKMPAEEAQKTALAVLAGMNFDEELLPGVRPQRHPEDASDAQGRHRPQHAGSQTGDQRQLSRLSERGDHAGAA
jgi:hypothetical protein